MNSVHFSLLQSADIFQNHCDSNLVWFFKMTSPYYLVILCRWLNASLHFSKVNTYFFLVLRCWNRERCAKQLKRPNFCCVRRYWEAEAFPSQELLSSYYFFQTLNCFVSVTWQRCFYFAFYSYLFITATFFIFSDTIGMFFPSSSVLPTLCSLKYHLAFPRSCQTLQQDFCAKIALSRA